MKTKQYIPLKMLCVKCRWWKPFYMYWETAKCRDCFNPMWRIVLIKNIEMNYEKCKSITWY